MDRRLKLPEYARWKTTDEEMARRPNFDFYIGQLMIRGPVTWTIPGFVSFVSADRIVIDWYPWGWDELASMERHEYPRKFFVDHDFLMPIDCFLVFGLPDLKLIFGY